MRTLRAFDDAEIRDLVQRDEFFWLDLTGPREDELRGLGEALAFDKRTVHLLDEPVGRPVLDQHD